MYNRNGTSCDSWNVNLCSADLGYLEFNYSFCSKEVMCLYTKCIALIQDTCGNCTFELFTVCDYHRGGVYLTVIWTVMYPFWVQSHVCFCSSTSDSSSSESDGTLALNNKVGFLCIRLLNSWLSSVMS